MSPSFIEHSSILITSAFGVFVGEGALLGVNGVVVGALVGIGLVGVDAGLGARPGPAQLAVMMIKLKSTVYIFEFKRGIVSESSFRYGFEVF